MRGHLGGAGGQRGEGRRRGSGLARPLRRGQLRHRKCPVRKAALGVRGRMAERGLGPHGSAGTPPPKSRPPEAPGGHMGGSRQPAARGARVLVGAQGARALEERGKRRPGPRSPRAPAAGIC